MQLPIQVTFRGVPHSAAIDAYVRARAAKLDTFAARITSCRVAVEAPHRHQQSGRHFRVRIDLTLPSGELVVHHTPDDSFTTRDAYGAIDQAFDQMGRRLQDYVRRHRGDVKPHESAYRQGRVSKLWGYEGFGFVETPTGEEVYFHRNSVMRGGFERLRIGSTVRFIEEEGEKGPQASTVALVG